MQAFIGCKVVLAQPMTKGDYIAQIQPMPNSANLVIVEAEADSPGYHLIYPGDYQSWSPRHVFDEAYRTVTAEERKLIRRWGAT